MPSRASASFGHTRVGGIGHRRALGWLARWLVIGSIVGSALIETRTVEFLAKLVPRIYPIRVASSKCISLIMKCLYQRSPFASWSNLIGVDISVLSVGHKRSFRYLFKQDRCLGFSSISARFRQAERHQRFLRIASPRESQLLSESYRKSLYAAAVRQGQSRNNSTLCPVFSFVSVHAASN